MKRLRIFKEYECKWSTPSIEIVPDQNQVVFAGDTMNLKCRAPSITIDKSAKLSWMWNSNITADIVDLGLYNDPQVFSNVKIENRNLEDSGIVARYNFFLQFSFLVDTRVTFTKISFNFFFAVHSVLTLSMKSTVDNGSVF